MKVRKGKVTVNIDTCPKTRWVDKCDLMLDINFELLVRFVEDECVGGHTDWNADENNKRIKKEVDELYAWWICWRKERDETNKYWKESQEILKEYKKDIMDYLKNRNCVPPKAKKKYEALFKRGMKLDRAQEKMEDDNLIRLMKIRRYLWT